MNNECKIVGGFSRVCEFGTKGCEIRHNHEIIIACRLLQRWQYAYDKTNGYDGSYEGIEENDPSGKLGEDTENFLLKYKQIET